MMHYMLLLHMFCCRNETKAQKKDCWAKHYRERLSAKPMNWSRIQPLPRGTLGTRYQPVEPDTFTERPLGKGYQPVAPPAIFIESFRHSANI